MVAQSVLAASGTVPPGWLVHSLHTYFLSPGNTNQPLEFSVVRRRDGGQYRARLVLVEQGDRLVAQVALSLHSPDPRAGGRLDHGASAPAAPDPETLTPAEQLRDDPDLTVTGQLFRATDAIDSRHVQDQPSMARLKGEPLPRTTLVWMRFRERLPDDLLTHQIALAYLSDTSLADSIVAPYGIVREADGVSNASLDHSVWFHRPFRADEWLLYEATSPAGAGERGLAHGRIFTRDGAHIASTTQEMLMRLPVGLGAPAQGPDAAE
jgi:acyl-CoA thioesterase-2